MLIQEKAGHINSFDINERVIDYLLLEWYETSKRIWTKHTIYGKEISFKFLNENPALTEGDILFTDEKSIIVVSIIICDCIVLEPKTMFEMACACYEIGNKHLPLFYEDDQLFVPFELPLFNLLQVQGYEIKKDVRKLLKPLRTTVAAHADINESTIFSKIMKLTKP